MPAAFTRAESASLAPATARAQSEQPPTPGGRRTIGRYTGPTVYKPGYPDFAEPWK